MVITIGRLESKKYEVKIEGLLRLQKARKKILFEPGVINIMERRTTDPVPRLPLPPRFQRPTFFVAKYRSRLGELARDLRIPIDCFYIDCILFIVMFT